MDRPGQVWCADITLAGSLEPVAFACSAADAPRAPLSGGDHGVAYPHGPDVADIEHRAMVRHRFEDHGEGGRLSRVEALKEAIYRFGPPDIMNSDQGAQLTSFAWTDRLRRSGIRISMDGKGRSLDNIFIERLWRTMNRRSAQRNTNASSCTPGRPGRRQRPPSGLGSHSTTIGGHTLPMAGCPPPWSTSTEPKPTGRHRL